MVNTAPRTIGNTASLFALRDIDSHCLCLATDKRGEREYKAVVRVNPINFSLLSEREQESVLEGFRVLLARLGTHQPLAIHIRIEPYDLQPYLNQITEATKAPSAPIREMAEDHHHFVLQLAAQRTLLQRSFSIILAAEREQGKGLNHREVFDRAKSSLELQCNDLLQDLERCGLSGQRLDNTELRRYYQACIHSRHAKEFPLPESNSAAVGRHIRGAWGHALTPPALSFLDTETTFTKTPVSANNAPPKANKIPGHTTLLELLAPSSIEITRHYVRVHHHTDEYLRGLCVIGLPATVHAGWLDRLLQIDEPSIDIMLYIEALDSTAYAAKLSRKLTGFRATQLLEERHGRTPDPYIKAARTEIEELREKLVAQTEKVYTTSLYLLLRAQTQAQLKERTNKLLSLLKSLELSAVECVFEHHKLWQCCLPDGRDLLKRHRLLDTSSLLTAFPFASSTLATETGILTGITLNGSLVIMDPISQQLENGHEVKFAKSGSGKSYDEKLRISRSLLAGYEVIVIDPENEYRALCDKYQGTHIRLSSGVFQLNPFDLAAPYEQTERNILKEKFESLHTLFDLLIAEPSSSGPPRLSHKEKDYLDRCFAATYAEKGITSDPTTHRRLPPSMWTLYMVLRAERCGPDIYDIGNRLQRHLEAFPEHSTVSLENPLIVFQIRDLDANLRAVGLFLITEFVWSHIRREKIPYKRIFVIDEAWSLLQFEQGGRFLASIARRARKYNLCLRTISQDVEDFLGSEWGRTILTNASMKFLMKQDETSIDAVVKAFKLSDGERKYLQSCTKGEGLFFAWSSHVPLKVVASATEHELATTNQEELRLKEQEHIQQIPTAPLPPLQLSEAEPQEEKQAPTEGEKGHAQNDQETPHPLREEGQTHPSAQSIP